VRDFDVMTIFPTSMEPRKEELSKGLRFMKVLSMKLLFPTPAGISLFGIFVFSFGCGVDDVTNNDSGAGISEAPGSSVASGPEATVSVDQVILPLPAGPVADESPSLAEVTATAGMGSTQVIQGAIAIQAGAWSEGVTALGLTDSSTRTYANAKVRLHRVNEKGQRSPEVLAETRSDSNGKYKFTLGETVSLSSIGFSVIAIPEQMGADPLESYVVSRTTHLTLSSTITTLASRSAISGSEARISSFSPPGLARAAEIAEGVVGIENDSKVEAAYDKIIENSVFRRQFNESSSDDISGVDLRVLPPEVIKVSIAKNGVVSSSRTARVGDSVSIEIEAIDPKGYEVEYVFQRFRNCGGDQVLQNWSSSGSLSYTFTEEDVTSCTAIWVGVRNGDGIDQDGVSFGDLQMGLTFTVESDLVPPVANSVNVKVNGVETANRSFAPGDTITIEALAEDPNSRPLEYKFELFRNCGGGAIIQDWSASSSVSYTFEDADMTNCTVMFIGVRNDDGHDYDSTSFGDLQMQVGFQVSDGRMPPVVNSVHIFQNGVETESRSFQVGSSITLKVNATDPNNLPLEYFFNVFRNCGGTSDLQNFSSIDEFTYTFKSVDITNCTTIFVGVRNNDGLDADGAMFGDLQYQVPVNINF
jgi:hypothetical protein